MDTISQADPLSPAPLPSPDQLELFALPRLPDTMDLAPSDVLAEGVTLTASPSPVRPAERTVVPALVPRLLAKLIDGTVAGVLYTLCTVVVADWLTGFLLGGVLASVYLLVSDGLDLEAMPRRSFGKKIMGLTVARLDGEPVGVWASVQRNWMFAVLYFVQAFTFAAPAVSILLLVATLGLIGYEVYWVATSPGGVRWGDDLAATEVLQVVAEPARPRG